MDEVGLSAFRLAREEYHDLTGEFEDGEPWYETRMTMFTDWCLLERERPDGVSHAEAYLARHWSMLEPDDRTELTRLTATTRSVFRILAVRGERLLLEDLARRSRWRVRCEIPVLGLDKGDVIGARIFCVHGVLVVGRGVVLHPREANADIDEVVREARARAMPPAELSNLLDKMRLKLDRYSSVRIQHIYRYPGRGAL